MTNTAILMEPRSLHLATRLEKVECLDSFPHNASNQKDDGSWRMAEGILRKDIQGGLEDSSLLPADFYQILSLARRRHESVGAPDSRRLAEALVPDFESFRQLADSVCLPLVLVELAIIDNESLERYRNSRRRGSVLAVGPNRRNDEQNPEFVSVLASFEEFSKDDGLMQAWDAATDRIVREQGKSIVGTQETYEYAYIWDELALTSVKPIQQPLPGSPGLSDTPIRSGIEVMNPSGSSVRIRLPEFYCFGEETSRETFDESQPKHNPDVPRKIAKDLLTYFRESAAEEGIAQTLDHAILIIVPFTRPKLYQTEGLRESGNSLDHQKSGDQEGGGVFILCRDAFDTSGEENKQRLQQQGLESMETRVRRLASVIMWLMHRSAMLEAKRERDNTRAQDVAQYFHMIAGSLRLISNSVSDLSASSDSIPEDVKKYIDATKREVEELERVGQIARHALLLRSGRSSPLSLDRVLGVGEFEGLIKSWVDKAVKSAKEQGVEECRRAAVKEVEVDFKWDVRGNAAIRTNEAYLRALFNEVFQNALEHGGFDSANKVVHVRVYSTIDNDPFELGKLVMRVANRVRDEKAQIALKELFGKRRFYLGISQIEMLAQVYDLDPPYFAVEENEAVVYCCVGVAA